MVELLYLEIHKDLSTFVWGNINATLTLQENDFLGCILLNDFFLQSRLVSYFSSAAGSDKLVINKHYV